VPDSKQSEKAEKHYKRVKEGLTRAFDASDETRIDLVDQPLIIFSDHHRGAKDGADDFWRCERAYNAALGYYFEAGYTLILLGDVDELWENKPEPVLKRYEQTIQLEREFRDADRLLRFWGNHDDLWRNEGQVKKHLSELLPDVPIREALRVHLANDGADLGLLFLVHGHQGTLDSERFKVVSRVAVRFGWRPIQRHFKMASTTPARDFKLRATHDAAMFDWAKNRDETLVLIAGHTHRPVFSTRTVATERTADDVGLLLKDLRAAQGKPDEIAILRAEFEFRRTPPFDEAPKEMPLPCYFNTGCCSFGDGDVTGIEVDRKEFRLIRWLDDKYEPKVQPLAHRPLKDVFEAVKNSRTRAPDLGERAIAAAYQ
jgi:UDP-2,3-diacylglucosamine pyrophosphatase LpxH